MTTFSDGTQAIDVVIKKILRQGKKFLPDLTYDLVNEGLVDAYRMLRLTTISSGTKVSKHTPSDINTIDMPSDCEKVLFVAVPVSGELSFLSRRDTIITTTTQSGGVETLDSDDGEGVSVLDDMWGAYSVRGGSNNDGYYTVEHDNRRIKVNSNSRTEVLLGYVTSGISSTEDIEIPNKYIDVLTATILYKESCYDPTLPMNTKAYIKQMYHEARYEIKKLEMASLTDFAHAIYRTYYPTPKR